MALLKALAFLPLVSRGLAGYTLQDDYNSANWNDRFTYFTAGDPTNGFVDYIGPGEDGWDSLVDTSGPEIFMGVDNTTIAPTGRKSVRVSSKTAYDVNTLFVLDLAHMPASTCGSWPAFWTLGDGAWPDSGEIDIIEGVNEQSVNDMTLHTSGGCRATTKSAYSFREDDNCNAGEPVAGSLGCGMEDPNPKSYGNGFNAQGGGAYVMEYTSDTISMWFFPNGQYPTDLLSDAPNPDNWADSSRTAFFDVSNPGCQGKFKNQKIIFTNTFCGDWAGSTFGAAGSSCSSKAASCEDFVANNPEAFTDSYWQIRSLKVYSSTGAGSNTPEEPDTSSAPAYSSAVAATTAYTAPTAASPDASSTPVATSSQYHGGSGWNSNWGQNKAVVDEPDVAASAPATTAPAVSNTYVGPTTVVVIETTTLAPTTVTVQPTQSPPVDSKQPFVAGDSNIVQINAKRGVLVVEDDGSVGIVGKRAAPFIKEDGSVDIVDKRAAPFVNGDGIVEIMVKRTAPFIEADGSVSIADKREVQHKHRHHARRWARH